MALITVVGGICADISAVPFEEIVERDSNPSRITVSVGGVGFNIASRLASLGHQARLVCALGGDEFAPLLRAAAERAKVELLPLAAERSGVYLCVNGPDGDMRVAFSDLNGTEAHITPGTLAPLIEQIDRSAACVLDGNLTAKAIEFIAENVSAPLFADPVSTKKAMRLLPVLPMLFAFKPNIYEARALTGLHEPGECAEALCRMGCGAVFVSCGAEGIYYADSHGSGYAPAERALGVTTGAGDAAGAMLLHCMLAGATAREAAEAANRFAAEVIASGATK